MTAKPPSADREAARDATVGAEDSEANPSAEPKPTGGTAEMAEAVNGVASKQNLAAKFQSIGPDIWQLPLAEPLRLARGTLTVSVNVAARQLRDTAFPEVVRSAIDDAKLPPGTLILDPMDFGSTEGYGALMGTSTFRIVG